MDPVVEALREQLDELAGMVATISEAEWRRPSACNGWTVGDVVLHLAQTNRTVPYAFTRAGLDPPRPVAFVLTPPGAGDEWEFGDPSSASTIVRGPALDLCLVAGQRAHAADTSLTATGPDAADVLALLRTFA